MSNSSTLWIFCTRSGTGVFFVFVFGAAVALIVKRGFRDLSGLVKCCDVLW